MNAPQGFPFAPAQINPNAAQPQAPAQPAQYQVPPGYQAYPGQAPAPQFAPPAQQYAPAPAAPPQNFQNGPAQSAGFDASDFADASTSALQDPSPADGNFLFVFGEGGINKGYGGLTFIQKLAVEWCDQTSEISATRAFIQGFNSDAQKRKGNAQLLAMTIAACGYASEAEFRAAFSRQVQLPNGKIMNEYTLLLASVANRDQVQGSRFTPDVLRGRKAFAQVTDSGVRTKKGEPIKRFAWAPLPEAQQSKIV